MTSKNEKDRRMHMRRDIGNRKTPSNPERAPGTDYLIACACFTCRKTFKRSYANSEPKCPDCEGQAHFMGRSFKSPKRSDSEQWKKIEKLYEHGFRFWSYRSYPDAEPLPAKLSEVDEFVLRNPDHPFKHKSLSDDA